MKVSDFEIDLAKLVATTKELNEIPAPTFEEEKKGRFVKAHFEAIGLEQVQVDRAGNILGYLFGENLENQVVLAAHLDTVFPQGTRLEVKEAGGKLIGPGIGDNNTALAALLWLAAFLKSRGNKPKQTLLFAATVGEEGLGDLRGIRTLMRSYHAHNRQPVAVIAVEGHGLGNICYQGVGSRRMKVTVKGPGGHSWDKAGSPSAIHGLAAIMQALAGVEIPTNPKTSFNIGTLEGGTSINTIAPQAAMVFEVRSLEEGSLSQTFDKMTELIKNVKLEGLLVVTEMVGERPAGGIAGNSPIVQICREVYQNMKIDPTYLALSTDANIPLSLGIPAVCIGITRGGNAHRVDEWVEVEAMVLGTEALLEITRRLAF